MSILKINDVFRYSKPYKPTPSKIDGYINHFSATNYPDKKLIVLDSGINPIASVNAISGKRKPAIIIRSSPHKIGSETTPWHDIFDVDNGHIRYFGDNKVPGSDPANAPGNKALLEAFETYHNPTRRAESIPLIFYKAVTRNNTPKGYIQFNGFGIITSVELISQHDRKLNRTFANYVFNFHVFSLKQNNEEFNWEWINQRRNQQLALKDTMEFAPASWKDWIKHGNKAMERCRRRVSKLLVESRNEQLPLKGSMEEKVVKEVYKFYHKRKTRFEAVASAITTKIFQNNMGRYHEGWITPSSTDGGADFYGRLDVGMGFGKAKIIVLGQAKCERPGSPTNGQNIARTVARLRRGWVGVYVTTSFFSEAVQREVIEDEYPIMLINGKKLAETILEILHDKGYSDVKAFLDATDLEYDELVKNRRPDELLLE